MHRLTKLLRCLSARSYRTALIRNRVAAAVEHLHVLSKLNCRTVVDIGANRGQFALVARGCYADARIASFEPLPGPAAKFRAIFRGDAKVRLHEAAIGPTRDQVKIHVSQRDDSSSLLPIGPLQSTTFPGTAEIGTATVEVGRLQDFVSGDEIELPALLKLDVQGFELQALLGCESLIDRFAYVYAECSFLELYSGQALADEVIAWLRERGFRLAGVHNVAYRDGQAVQADMLFKSKACT